MSLSEYIADYILGLEYEKLPAPVRETAVSAVWNYMGCLCGGLSEPEPKTVLDMLRLVASAGACRIPGTALRSDPASFALYCGTAANALGFDDMYKDGIYHPGVPAVTAALAVATLTRPSGREFLAAMVAGYEVANRVAKTVNPSHYAYWHTAGTVGAFGAAAAAGKLLGLDRGQMISALGTAGTQAAGLQECNGNMAQRLHLGAAARNGVTAALLAKSGFDGPKSILDGKSGFIAAMSEFSGDPMAQFYDLGEKHTILDTTFKFYPCCGHIHACIDAALFAMEKSGFKAEDLKEVRVGTYATAISNSGNPAPQTVLQAKFSIPYCVAAGLMEGNVTMGSFAQWPPAPGIAALMDRVRLYVDETCEQNFFQGRRGGAATLVTDSGEYTETRYSRRGDPDCPLSREDLRQKFDGLAGLTLPPETVERLAGLLDKLPSLEDASVLVDF